MEDTAYRAIAIVGVGAILPDAPDVPSVLGEHHERPLQHQRGRRRTAGTPRSTTTPIRSAPDKTYSKIGGWVREYDMGPAGVAAADPAARGRRDGRRPEVGGRLHARGAGGLRLARAAARPRSHRGDPRQRDGAARSTTSPSLRVLFPEYARELTESASFAALPAAVRRDIARELHERMRQASAGDHRRHDARRAGQLHRRPHREPLQLPRPELRRATPPAPRRWRRSTRRSRG